MSVSSRTGRPRRRKLPVWQTVKRNYADVVGGIGSIYAMSWPWLIVAVPLAGLVTYLAMTQQLAAAAGTRWQLGARAPPVDPAIPRLIWSLLTNIGTIALAFAWQRRVLLREAPGFFAGTFVQASFWRYLRAGLLLGLVLILPLGVLALGWGLVAAYVFEVSRPMDMPSPFAGLMTACFVLGFLTVFAIGFRLVLVLPARAAGHNGVTFRKIWKRSRGNTWRIVGVNVLCALPFMVPLMIYGGLAAVLVDAAKQGQGWLVTSLPWIGAAAAVLGMMLYPLWFCIGYGLMSHIYDHFFRRLPAASRALAPHPQSQPHFRNA